MTSRPTDLELAAPEVGHDARYRCCQRRLAVIDVPDCANVNCGGVSDSNEGAGQVSTVWFRAVERWKQANRRRRAQHRSWRWASQRDRERAGQKHDAIRRRKSEMALFRRCIWQRYVDEVPRRRCCQSRTASAVSMAARFLKLSVIFLENWVSCRNSQRDSAKISFHHDVFEIIVAWRPNAEQFCSDEPSERLGRLRRCQTWHTMHVFLVGSIIIIRVDIIILGIIRLSSTTNI